MKGTSFKENQVDVFETEESNLPQLVMFRTSNSSHLFPFLFHHFSRIVAVAGIRMFFDLIEDEAPHVVIAELPERYIASRAPRSWDNQDWAWVPEDDAPSTFQEVTGRTPSPAK